MLLHFCDLVFSSVKYIIALNHRDVRRIYAKVPEHWLMHSKFPINVHYYYLDIVILYINLDKIICCEISKFVRETNSLKCQATGQQVTEKSFGIM